MLLTGIVALAQNATNTRRTSSQGRNAIQGVVNIRSGDAQSPRSAGNETTVLLTPGPTLHRTGFAEDYRRLHHARFAAAAQGRGDADGNLVGGSG